MKKTIILLALCCGLSATPVMTTSCSSFYGSLVEDQATQLNNLAALLSQVNDLSTANAAAPQLDQYGLAFGEVFKGIAKAGQPSILELLRIKNQLEDSSTSEAVKNIIGQYIRLSMANFYGSTELKNSFYNQIGNIQKAAFKK